MKKTIFKKAFLICLLLAVAMVLPLFSETAADVVVTEAEAQTYDELQEELKKAQANYDAKVAERKAAQKRLAEVMAEIKKTENKLLELEVQFLALEEEQSFINSEKEVTAFLIEAYEERQSYYQSLIDEQQAELEETLELYATVLRYKYENGETSTLEILFNSQDFEQFLSRLQYFDSIIEYNDTVAGALKKIEAHLTTLQEQYDSALDNLSYYTDLLAQQEADIQARQEQMDAIYEEYQALSLELKTEEEQWKDIEDGLKTDEAILKDAVKAAEEAVLNYQNSVSAFSWPLKSGVWYYISSYFGYRQDPLGRGWKHHSGIDIAAVGGNAVLAVCDGVVTTATYHKSYGYYVVIYHGDGISTLYAHMQKNSLTVKVGDNVSRGQQIGKVGTTGDSTGNHLHFSVIKSGSYVNPDDYLPDGYYVKKYYPASKPNR